MREIFKKILQENQALRVPAFVRRTSVSVPIQSGKIITLIGPRRSGKSTFFFQIFDQLIQEGIRAQQCFFINKEGSIVTLNSEKTIQKAGITIQVIPFAKWVNT